MSKASLLERLILGEDVLPGPVRAAAFNPDQARDDHGKWSGPGGAQRFIDDHTRGRAILDRARTQPTTAPQESGEDARQQALADAQTNPNAHPPFVLGMDNAVGGEVQRYVAAYGQEFAAQPRPTDVAQGAMKECYKNATLLVMGREDLTYAEGFAKTAKTGDLAFMHAWAVDKDNRVVDPTWTDGHSYFGVKYDRAAVLAHTYRTKMYGVLSGKFKDAQKVMATGGPKLRALGDIAGHEFHGNQWTDASGSVSQEALDARFPKAPASVDGRVVGSDVPNMSSIGASLTDYEILDGVREVQVSDFEDNGKPSFYSSTEKARVEKLAESIKQSGKITPLIVVVDKHRSPYVLEGGHRFDALKLNGAKSFPALVVIDTSELKVLAFNPDQPRDEHGRWTNTGGSGPFLGRPASAYSPSRPDGLDTRERFSDGHGHYTPERAALHEEIIAKHMAGVTPVDNPTVVVLGGAPGVGKSTTVRTEGIGGANTVLINPDDIRNDLPEYAPDAMGRRPALTAFTHEEASDIAAKMVRRTASESKNAVLDGTGDSSIEKLGGKVAVLRSRGATVEAVYVTTSVEVAQQRADARSNNPASSSFGRVVPPTAMREMHQAVSRVFPEAVRQGLFDRARLFDSTSGHTLVASAVGRKLTIHDQGLWDAFVGKGQ